MFIQQSGSSTVKRTTEVLKIFTTYFYICVRRKSTKPINKINNIIILRKLSVNKVIYSKTKLIVKPPKTYRFVILFELIIIYVVHQEFGDSNNKKNNHKTNESVIFLINF